MSLSRVKESLHVMLPCHKVTILEASWCRIKDNIDERFLPLCINGQESGRMEKHNAFMETISAESAGNGFD